MRVWTLFLLPLEIYFYALCQYSVWQIMLLLESLENQMPIKATVDPVLKTTGDAVCIEFQLVTLKDMKCKPDTMCLTMSVTTGFHFFRI